MSKSWEQKRLFTEQVIQDVLSLDVAKVLSRRINIKRKGYQYTALCPFHNDKNYGNFMISSHKGIYKCFACGEGGNAIKFVSETEGLNFIQAAYKIALEEGLISQEEYDENLTGRKYTKKEIKTIELTSIKSKPEIEVAKDSDKNIVYSKFLEILEDEFEFGLTKEDWEYLIEKRGLSVETINERRYRSLSFSQYMRHKITAKLLSELQKEDLVGIPGFYQEKSKGEWVWSFPGTKGILIPIVNSKLEVVALQIRKKEKKEDSSRYTWMSSAFAAYNEELFKNGSSPGAPVDVIYPEEVHHSALFITEGRFKSESILETFNAPSISVQGVGSWKGIENEIKDVFDWMDRSGRNFLNKQVVIAYDSDMQFNYAVYRQLKNLTDHIRENFPEISIKIALWDYAEDQKGIDDFIDFLKENGVSYIKDEFFFIEEDKWCKEYDKEVAQFVKDENLINEWEIDPHAFKHRIQRTITRLREQAI